MTPFETRLLGRTIHGKYQLVDILSSGYLGVVFIARHLFAGQALRTVLVKLSRRTQMSDVDALGVLADSITLVKNLNVADHEGRPFLGTICDLGVAEELDRRAFVVMDTLEAKPLSSHTHAHQRLRLDLGLRFCKQLVAALAFVHAKGAFHRDLAPESVLVDRHGQLRLVDVAPLRESATPFDYGDDRSFRYVAPETLQGRSLPASDVYSVGLILYQLFTGGGPHLDTEWDTSSQAAQINAKIKAEQKFPPPSEYHSDIRADFRWIDGWLLRCLEADPTRRFTNAVDLYDALQANCPEEEKKPRKEKKKKRKPRPELELESEPEPEPEPQPEPEYEDAENEERELPPPTPREEAKPRVSELEVEAMFREIRRLLGARAYDQVIDRLDVNRPAEWATVDVRGARTLRVLGQAYIGRGEIRLARECLEQLRSCQREREILPLADYAAALSDLVRCYRALGMEEQANVCLEEVKKLG
jgi:serine/threonine protein kinase